eukprot:750549-Hanusia_phi.AAC.2
MARHQLPKSPRHAHVPARACHGAFGVSVTSPVSFVERVGPDDDSDSSFHRVCEHISQRLGVVEVCVGPEQDAAAPRVMGGGLEEARRPVVGEQLLQGRIAQVRQEDVDLRAGSDGKTFA